MEALGEFLVWIFEKAYWVGGLLLVGVIAGFGKLLAEWIVRRRRKALEVVQGLSAKSLRGGEGDAGVAARGGEGEADGKMLKKAEKARRKSEKKRLKEEIKQIKNEDD